MASVKGPNYHRQHQNMECAHCGKTFRINASTHNCCSDECKIGYGYLKRYGEQGIRDIVKKYEWDGMAANAIAEHYNVDHKCIRALLRYCGVRERPKHVTYRWSLETIRKFAQGQPIGVEGQEQLELFG